MPKILRNLDRLAGVMGNVLVGEQARKQALLQAHLERSQQRFLEERRAQNQRETRMKVQEVADKAALERERYTQTGRKEIERMGIEAGKYDKSKWAYLSRSLKLDPKFAALYDFSESRLKELDDILSGNAAMFLTPQQEANIQNERLYFNLLFDELTKEVAGGIRERVYGRIKSTPGEKTIFGTTIYPEGKAKTKPVNPNDPLGIR